MKYNKEELERLLLVEKLSYEKVGRIFGITGAGIKKAGERMGIEFPSRRRVNDCEKFNTGKKKDQTCLCLNCGKSIIRYPTSKGKYCSNKCQHEYESKAYIEDWKNGLNSGGNNFMLSDTVRKYLFVKFDNKCTCCGCGFVNKHTGLSILQVHHINGDPTDHREDNLTLLCPNCHAMTENYGSRNRNGNHARTVYYGRAKPK